MKKIKKLTKEQKQLVNEARQLVERMEKANIGMAVDSYGCTLTFFNLDGVENYFSVDDIDQTDDTIWCNIYETPSAEVLDLPERTAAIVDVNDTFVGFKFK